jgi:hypothetical protein
MCLTWPVSYLFLSSPNFQYAFWNSWPLLSFLYLLPLFFFFQLAKMKNGCSLSRVISSSLMLYVPLGKRWLVCLLLSHTLSEKDFFPPLNFRSPDSPPAALSWHCYSTFRGVFSKDVSIYLLTYWCCLFHSYLLPPCRHSLPFSCLKPNFTTQWI